MHVKSGTLGSDFGKEVVCMYFSTEGFSLHQKGPEVQKSLCNDLFIKETVDRNQCA